MPGRPKGAVSLVGSKGKGQQLQEPGRVCEQEGCTTQLSIYNDRTMCSLHEINGPTPYQRY